jgi:hypothetical protein
VWSAGGRAPTIVAWHSSCAVVRQLKKTTRRMRNVARMLLIVGENLQRLIARVDGVVAWEKMPETFVIQPKFKTVSIMCNSTDRQTIGFSEAG